MKVADIRPDSLMAGQRAAMERDIARLAAARDGFVAVDCPACDGADSAVLYDKYGLTHRRCAACRTQFISPRPGPEALTRFYAESENYAYWAKHIYPASAETRRRQIFVPRADLVESQCRARGALGGTVVEVGAGFGLFCEELAARGSFAHVIGIEPSPALADACRAKGIAVIESPFETATLPAPADVIAAFEVVEHLFRPKELLDFAFASLNPGGLLILTCPNIEGFETIALGRASAAVDHQHLNYFTPRSLALLAGRAIFAEIEVTTPGRLDVDLVRRALAAGEVDRAALGGFVAHLIDAASDEIDERFQAFLQAAGLSSNMMMVARKPAAGA